MSVPVVCDQCGVNPPTVHLVPSFAPQHGWYGCDECAGRTSRCSIRPLSAGEVAELQHAQTESAKS